MRVKKEEERLIIRCFSVYITVAFCMVYSLVKAEDSSSDSTEFYRALYNTSKVGVDSSQTNLQKCCHYFSKTRDTLSLTKSHIRLSDSYAPSGDYNRSFEHLWIALDYAEKQNDSDLQYEVHNRLGRLYNVFDKNEQALYHETKTLQFAKEHSGSAMDRIRRINAAYYNFVNAFRKREKYDIALTYLDTCHMYKDSSKVALDKRYFLDAEKGNILLHQNKVTEALSLLIKAERDFETLQHSYVCIVDFYLGNTYYALEDWTMAERYYRRTVQNIDKHKAHFDAKAESMNRLSRSLHHQGRYKESYEVLRKSKDLNDAVFSTKSLFNAELLDIRDIYQERIKERDQKILEQENELIGQRAKTLRNRNIYLAIVFVLLLLLLYSYNYHLRRKFEVETHNQKLEAQMQEERSAALLEHQNKELMTYTLQLIDKETLLCDLQETIDVYDSEKSELARQIRQRTKNRIDLWSEFEKRFIEVNTDFYDQLKRLYPSLTPTELKHCALIKLNFTAKEMAQLLNISIHGVNTSRYRIRKKLGLTREENLTSFMDGV